MFKFILPLRKSHWSYCVTKPDWSSYSSCRWCWSSSCRCCRKLATAPSTVNRRSMCSFSTGSGQFGIKIRNGLNSSNYFNLEDSLNGKPVTESAIREAVKKGDYIIGVVIPPGVTKRSAPMCRSWLEKRWKDRVVPTCPFWKYPVG